MASPTAVVKGIFTAAKLAKAISDMSSVIPSPPNNLTDKHRWVTVTIFNQTQYNVVYKSSYFDSGRFWTAPTSVEPFESMTFSGCDKDGSFFTGVSGGTSFDLQMPLEGGGYEVLSIGVGFTNPEAGALKSSGIFSDSAESAYNSVSDNTTSITSSDFSGKNQDGNDVKINFMLTASPGQEASITITEQIIS